MAIFKCLMSGNTVEFTQEGDIAQMRRHHQYEEVYEQDDGALSEEQVEEVKKSTRGRKPKVEE